MNGRALVPSRRPPDSSRVVLAFILTVVKAAPRHAQAGCAAGHAALTSRAAARCDQQ